MKDAFAKKFLVPGEIPLAACSHRFFGNTLLKAGHLMRSRGEADMRRRLALMARDAHDPLRSLVLQCANWPVAKCLAYPPD